MKLRMFQVDAFADRPFEGNPAAVVPLDAWLPDALMQKIAMENNLAETAFFVREGDGFGLRWFTPAVEVPLCGHATLASAHVLFSKLGWSEDAVVFASKSGPLRVTRKGDGYEMDFPTLAGPEAPVDPAFAEALGATPELTVEGHSWLAVFRSADEVRALTPDFRKLAELTRARPGVGVAATAAYAGPEGWDFVSRFFAPAEGIDEDPVTGSAHCTLTPYWAGRLGKPRLVARQISPRGGTVFCEARGDRVGLGGRCADYLDGEITLP